MFAKTIFAVLAAIVLPAFAAEWMTDYEAAKQKAAAEHKPILLDFTGSDWCGACKHLHSNIFEKPEFDAFVNDKFVLLEIDCPHGNKMPAEEKARNEALVESFSVRAFPTVLVLSPKGEVLGGFLGAGFKMEEVKRELQQGADNLPVLEKAQALTGAGKLQALHEFYKALNNDTRPCATSIEEQIIQNDPQDTLGYAHRRAVERQRRDIKRRTMALMQRRDPAQILAAAAELQPTVLQENMPLVMELKITGNVLAAQSEEDLTKARDAVQAELDAMPESPQKEEVGNRLKATFSDIPHLFLQLKAMRARQAELDKMR